jgi:hypothetical protein
MNKITRYAHNNKITLKEVAEKNGHPYITIKVWTKTNPDYVKGLIDALVIDRDSKLNKGEKDEKN